MWKSLVERSGFQAKVGYPPMHLLRLQHLIEDEGLIEVLRIAKSIRVSPKPEEAWRCVRYSSPPGRSYGGLPHDQKEARDRMKRLSTRQNLLHHRMEFASNE